MSARRFGPFEVRREGGILVIFADPGQLDRIQPEVEELLQPSIGLRPALEWVRAHGPATSREVADRLGLSIQNTSNKLAALYRDGYLSRSPLSAGSGGVEFEYAARGEEKR